MNTVGEPDEGKPHVRFDEGRLARSELRLGDLGTGGKLLADAPRPTAGRTSRLLY
jgi:hypothetical protein